MKKLFLLLALVAVSVTVASAQNYKSGIGLRLGYPLAFDYKMNMNEKNSMEFNLGFPAFLGVQATGAYQWNYQISSSDPNWNAYVGPAIGIGFLGGTYWGGAMIGFGAHAGIEYKFNGPFALGIDYKPMFNYVLGKYTRGVYYGGFYDFALVGRYCF